MPIYYLKTNHPTKQSMKHKQFYFRLLVLLLATAVNYAHAQNSLITKHKDGSQSGTLVNNIDRITFSSGNLVIKKKDATSSSMMISDIDKMSFGIYSGIVEVPNIGSSLQIYPNAATSYIMLKNAPEGEIKIAVYSMTGTLLKSIKLGSASQQIDISKLTNGLYLLKVNTTTFKFMKL